MIKGTTNRLGQWTLEGEALPVYDKEKRQNLTDQLSNLLSEIKIKTGSLINRVPADDTIKAENPPIMKDFSTKKEELLSNLTSKK